MQSNSIISTLSTVTLERRRDKAKEIKQGMMQQLLTGKVRLVAPEGSGIGQSGAEAQP
ncbi:hypothetical protein [Methanocalculus taiwanensis]|uniref:hypothetical protein n=1 Tax=Methanocalculus taiwanensis TaxID=106207 RepID=UPI002101A02F|nr:hypothetical protein [Methanocalculus taiwanensis]